MRYIIGIERVAQMVQRWASNTKVVTFVCEKHSGRIERL